MDSDKDGFLSDKKIDFKDLSIKQVKLVIDVFSFDPGHRERMRFLDFLQVTGELGFLGALVGMTEDM